MNLGYFANAEEAALCVARSPEGQAAAAERAALGQPGTLALVAAQNPLRRRFVQRVQNDEVDGWSAVQ